ncbi:MAG: thiol peroxidase [Phycisphaerales bacterium JB039]
MARTGEVTGRGNPLTLEGESPEVGAQAPQFVAVANDMSEQKLSDYRGKTVILTTAPSLETAVCDAQGRAFNERATSLPQEVVVVMVSMDLPFAQKRWCGSHGIESVVTLSDYKHRAVAEAYGLRIRETGLLARTVWVIDPEGVIRYRQIVPEITSEPDYDAALEAAQQAAGA